MATLEAQASYMDFIMETAKTSKVEAGEMLVTGLMAGSKADLRLGYSLGSALIAAAGVLGLTADEVALVAGRVAEPKDGIVEYGPTIR